jgi:alpha-L-rhamnosidase
MNVAGFFTKWTRDLEDAQFLDGAYPAVAPNPSAWSIGDGGPAWADAGVICPWTIYQCYGDIRLLEARYASMQRFIEFLSQTSQNGLRCYAEYKGWHGFGDWLALDGSNGREGGTSKELIGTAFFAYSSHLLARIAGILGKDEDAERYENFSRQAREAFVKHFVLPDGTLKGGTQTSYVLALYFDLLPADLRSIAVAELVRNIGQRDNHLSTGFVGTPYLNGVLSEMGHLDTAYELLKQTTWPSWLYSVTQGATTIWERWDGWTPEKGFQSAEMNSFNHYAYGSCGEWMYGRIGAIDFDELQPGYKHIVINPVVARGLTSGRASLEALYGTVRTDWRLSEDGRFSIDVTIPANTTATVFLPGKYMEGDLDAGVTPVERSGRSMVELSAGTYHLSSSLGSSAR